MTNRTRYVIIYTQGKEKEGKQKWTTENFTETKLQWKQPTHTQSQCNGIEMGLKLAFGHQIKMGTSKRDAIGHTKIGAKALFFICGYPLNRPKLGLKNTEEREAAHDRGSPNFVKMHK